MITMITTKRPQIEKTKNAALLYVHGRGGSAEEAKHYEALFPERDVFGLDYRTDSPWETNREIEWAVGELSREFQDIILIANSIGAFYSMNADICEKIGKAYFISPMVDLVKLITDMMKWANVTEEDLKREKTIQTEFGEELSWEYLCYVREHPIKWTVPTVILYGTEDHLVSMETMKGFAEKIHADLTIMTGGEHWFHTEEQMAFLDRWIRQSL